MKKTLALVLAMLMLLTAFVACAPNNEKKDGKTDKATAADKADDKATET